MMAEKGTLTMSKGANKNLRALFFALIFSVFKSKLKIN